ncbi:MAG: APC family permease [Armatimonadetes bacterium]|nr:APC family permease [Armatimonadota bacterium]
MSQDTSPQPPSGGGRRTRGGGLHHEISGFRRLLFGQPIETEHQQHALLPKVVALPVFSSDAISSSAYAIQEILLALGAAGLAAPGLAALYSKMTIGITVAIVALLWIVVTSYWQTIFAYVHGGGSYIVSRENLGTNPSLIAGAALLIDYVLTVAVSVASGVQNLTSTPLGRAYNLDPVLLCVCFIGILTLANLRGLKESGTMFAVPTYLFISCAGLMIILGTVGPHLGWTIYEDTVNQTFKGGHAGTAASLAPVVLIAVALKAFASGCAAMTGTEAVADGVPAFRKPQPRNAALTLVMMASIMTFLIGGFSLLSTRLHVVYWSTEHQHANAVVEQLSGAIFGSHAGGLRAVLYWTMQASTAGILLVAANTAFADFPRLAYFMSRDRFLPRQLANLGDKLVFSNGIGLLGILAIVLIVAFHGSVDALIPLYALGVFTAFTLSQSGMARHWIKLKSFGWHLRASINGFGAICTFMVLCVIVAEKFVHGAYWAIIAGAVLFTMFKLIWAHYEYMRRKLSIVNWKPERDLPTRHTALIPVPSLHRGIFPALDYARSLFNDCRALHIEIDPADTARLRKEWEQYVGDEVPLVILPSLYRSLIAPMLVYLDEVQKERENHTVTVIVPEYVSSKWYHSLLHNKNGLLLRLYLLNRPGVIVTNVRYFLDREVDAETLARMSAQQKEHAIDTRT